MPTPTQKNAEDIESLGKRFDAFRSDFGSFRDTTNQSLGFIKWVGGPFLLAILGIGVTALWNVGGINRDLGKVEGKVDGLDKKVDAIDGRLDRIEGALMKAAGALEKHAGAEVGPRLEAVAERLASEVNRFTGIGRVDFLIDESMFASPKESHLGSPRPSLVYGVRVTRMPSGHELTVTGKSGLATFVRPSLASKGFSPPKMIAVGSLADKAGRIGQVELIFADQAALDRFKEAIRAEFSADHARDGHAEEAGIRGFITFDADASVN